MPLARTADLVAAAHHAGTGVAAFNVITLEHAEAIVAGAEQASRLNIGTLLNVRFTGVVRAFSATDEKVTDPRRYLTPARVAVSDAVAAIITAID